MARDLAVPVMVSMNRRFDPALPPDTIEISVRPSS
jgi:hypothetical protein